MLKFIVYSEQDDYRKRAAVVDKALFTTVDPNISVFGPPDQRFDWILKNLNITETNSLMSGRFFYITSVVLYYCYPCLSRDDSNYSCRFRGTCGRFISQGKPA